MINTLSVLSQSFNYREIDFTIIISHSWVAKLYFPIPYPGTAWTAHHMRYNVTDFGHF